MIQLSAAIVAASVAVIVAYLTPAVTSLRARRQAIDEKFDHAISALVLVEGARLFPTDPQDYIFSGEGWTDEDLRQYRMQMQKSRIEYLIAQTADARAALAAVGPYVPEVTRPLTTTWEAQGTRWQVGEGDG